MNPSEIIVLCFYRHGNILPTVDIQILSKDCVREVHRRPEEELWWQNCASSSPVRCVREITVSHPRSPDAGLGRTVPCSPFQLMILTRHFAVTWSQYS